MKLIEPKVEEIIQKSGIEGIYKQIEQCARVCYKSEDKMKTGYKITPDFSEVATEYHIPLDTFNNDEAGIKYKIRREVCDKIKMCIEKENYSKEFVDKLIDKKHYAMLEHGTVYLKFPSIDNAYFYKHNAYSKVYERPISKICYVTTNFRVLIENNLLNDLAYICEPTFHDLRYTFKITTSIGIVRELLRHRVFSFANESTRYCNYSNDKFGNELTFIKPYWIKDQIIYYPFRNDAHDAYEKIIEGKSVPLSDEEYVLIWQCHYAEQGYKKLIGLKLSPQQAREILPLCTKSELIMTGFESDWKDFLNKRYYEDTGKVHPDLYNISKEIKNIVM